MSSTTGVRLTLKFNFNQQLKGCGWSESYDLAYADLPTAVAAKDSIKAFMVDRCNTLGAGPLLVTAVLGAYVVPTTPGAPPPRRPTLELPILPFPPAGNAYNKAFNPTKPFTADFAPTVYYVSLQTNLSGSPVYRRNAWLAGLPDIADETDTVTIVDPATLTAVTKFLGDLENKGTSLASSNGISIRSIDRTGGNPIKSCTAWNLGPNTYTVPGHGFAVNQPIIAEGMKTIPGGFAPRGRYLVANVLDANTIALAGAQTPTAPLKTGGFRAVVYAFNQVAVATPLGFTKRNKGRPFELLVGRRRRPLITRV